MASQRALQIKTVLHISSLWLQRIIHAIYFLQNSINNLFRHLMCGHLPESPQHLHQVSQSSHLHLLENPEAS